MFEAAAVADVCEDKLLAVTLPVPSWCPAGIVKLSPQFKLLLTEPLLGIVPVDNLPALPLVNVAPLRTWAAWASPNIIGLLNGILATLSVPSL